MTRPLPAKILICGKGSIACRALGYLLDYLALAGAGSEVLALPVAADTATDTWEPSLRALATQRTVRCIDTTAAAGLGAGDLLLSLQFDRIIRLPTLGGARAFNLHFSALPAYRGCYTSVWPLCNGEARAGVTLHVLTAGIDDGDIVGQRVFDLPEWMTAWQLYGLLQDHAYALFKQHLPALLRAEEVLRPQAPTTLYYDRHSIDFGSVEIDVAGSDVQTAVDWIRSRIFDPRQFPTFRGREVVAGEAVDGPPAPAAAPGTVLLESASHVVVACRDGLLRLTWRQVRT